jgi:hypothetical protein
MRICTDGGGMRWQLNPAARQSASGRMQSDSQWQDLALRLVQQCSAQPDTAQGLITAGEPPLQLAWTAVVLDDGWLVWLDVQQPTAQEQAVAR